jgi:hypothetical protein
LDEGLTGDSDDTADTNEDETEEFEEEPWQFNLHLALHMDYLSP